MGEKDFVSRAPAEVAGGVALKIIYELEATSFIWAKNLF